MKQSSLSLKSLFFFSLSSFLIFPPEAACSKFTRHDFPSTFVFGAGTSAFQYEGAYAEDGRMPSVLDNGIYACMSNKTVGTMGADGYHKHKEDVQLMSDTGLEAYRFSISWSRLIPNGRGYVNKRAIKYYNDILDELAQQGIPAHITLNHLDLPLVLQIEYGGWLSSKIVNDFREFADVCFREFGNKVSHWTTINEPNVYGMVDRSLPFCDFFHQFGMTNSMAGDSTDMTYITVHNMLIAHSEIVKLYRDKYQYYQGGQIGLSVYSFWCKPFSNSSSDVEATHRVKKFMFDWILNPIVYGDYPELMKKTASLRLPLFTNSQSEALKGSFDFIGINYYALAYISDNSNCSKCPVQGFHADLAVIMRVDRNGPPAHGPFLPNHVPKDFSGLQKMMQYLKESYGNPPIYIQENGFAMGVDNALNDSKRIAYLKGYMGSTLEAIRHGADIRGYFVWSFVDVFEFLGGYKIGYGLYHVDFEDEKRPRTPKLSALWYSKLLKNNTIAAFNIQKAGLKELSSASK